MSPSRSRTANIRIGAAPLVDSTDRACFAQDDGAAGEGVFILGMPDAQAGDRSEVQGSIYGHG